MSMFTGGATSGEFERFPDFDMVTILSDPAVAFRTENGDKRAERNDRLDEYEFLQEASCPCLDLASMENKYIAKYYGRCSKEAHSLQVLLESCHDREKWLAGWKYNSTEKEQGCRVVEKQKRPKRGYSKKRELRGTCPDCHEGIKKVLSPSRLIAIYKLRPSEFWKAVVRRKEQSRVHLYEGSATCNIYGLPDHCVNPDHINLETKRHNARRKRHHHGTSRCCCYKPCIGSDVRQCPDGGSAETKYNLVTWYREDAIKADLVPDDTQPIDEVQWELWETTEHGSKLLSDVLSSAPRREPGNEKIGWDGGDREHLTLEVKPSSAP